MIGQNGEQASPPGSKEAAEWTRLNVRKKQLSGRPHYQPVYYFAHDPLDSSKKYPCGVQNQRGYMQGDGSCPVFSIKSLVASVVGTELAAMHIDYLQRHNGDQHLRSLQHKSEELRKRIEVLEPLVVPPKATAKERVLAFRKEELNLSHKDEPVASTKPAHERKLRRPRQIEPVAPIPPLESASASLLRPKKKEKRKLIFCLSQKKSFRK